VISALSHLTRLAPGGFVFAREGVFALVEPAVADAGAHGDRLGG
jgi:hypothetical protein